MAIFGSNTAMRESTKLLPSPPHSLRSIPSNSSLAASSSASPLREDLVARLSAIRTGQIPGNVHQVKISASELETLLRTDAHFNDKACFSYFPESELLSVYMPTTLHEVIAANLRAYFVALIPQVVQQIKSSVLRRSLPKWDETGSPTVKFPPDEDGQVWGTHVPDGSLYVEGYPYPSFAFEVSYTQRVKALGRVAEDCTLGSDGLITVIGVDAKDGHKALLYVWQLGLNKADQMCECKEVFKEVVHDKSGVALEGSISLHLSDFFVNHIQPGSEDDLPVELPLKVVSDAVARGRHLEAVREQSWRQNAQILGPRCRRAAGYGKRRRDSTPPEELSVEDSHKWQKLENADARREGKLQT